MRLDDQHTFFADSLIIERHQSLLVERWQRGVRNIEAQVHRGGDFIHVLATGTLGPDLGDFDFPVSKFNSVG